MEDKGIVNEGNAQNQDIPSAAETMMEIIMKSFDQQRELQMQIFRESMEDMRAQNMDQMRAQSEAMKSLLEETKRNADVALRQHDYDRELKVIEERERLHPPPLSRFSSTPSLSDESRNEPFSLPNYSTPTSSFLGSTRGQGNKGPQTKLPVYEGKEDIEVFLVPFERLAGRYGWEESEKVDRLFECLKGKAMWYVCSLPGDLRKSYELLKDSLTKRFGRRDPPTTARNKLHEVRQKSLSNDEFGEEVRRLVTLAYPGVDLALQDQLAAEAFLKGYKNSRIAYDVLNQKPRSLNGAIELVTAQEHNYRATVGREKDALQRERSRRVSWADENIMGEENEETETLSTQRVQFSRPSHVQALEARIQELESLVKSSSLDCRSRLQRHDAGKTTNDKACFKCGEKGHFRRECRSRSPSPVLHQRSPSPNKDEAKIARVNNKEKSIVIPVLVNGKLVDGVIDTGADATVICDKLAESLGITPKEPKPIRLMNAEDGAEMTAVGNVTATFQIGQEVKDWSVFIAPIRDSLLLGIDILQAFEAVIHTGERNIEINGDLISGRKVGSDLSIACSVVRVDSEVLIPGESEQVIIGRLETPSPRKPGILESVAHRSGVRIGSCITVMTETVPVRVLNLKDHEVKLKEGSYLGRIEEADMTEEDESSSVECCPSMEAANDNEVPPHLQQMYNAAAEGLDEHQCARFRHLLNEFKDVFAKDDYDLGRFSGVKHRISIDNSPPIRQPASSTPHPATGFTPNLLMLGREVHAPHDLLLKEVNVLRDEYDVPSYLERLRQGKVVTESLARKMLKSKAVRQKKLYDMRALECQYKEGDLVYVRNERRKTGVSPKLQPVWDGPFVVTKVFGPVVYEVTGRKRCVVVHHDRLKRYQSEVVPGWAKRLKHDLSRAGNANLETIDEESEEAAGESLDDDNSEEDKLIEEEHRNGSLRSCPDDWTTNNNVSPYGRARRKPTRMDL